jgi:hypothetical protein
MDANVNKTKEQPPASAALSDDNLNAPWSLHFDRDGTEDVAIICDANGHDLVTSRHFWLPEGEDPIPPTLAAMRLIVTAPVMLDRLRKASHAFRNPSKITPGQLWAIISQIDETTSEATREPTPFSFPGEAIAKATTEALLLVNVSKARGLLDEYVRSQIENRHESDLRQTLYLLDSIIEQATGNGRHGGRP